MMYVSFLLAFLLAGPKQSPQEASGEIVKVKSRTVTLRVDGRSLPFIMSDRTKLLDAADTVRATGSKDVGGALSAGRHVRITWTPYWVPDGAGIVTGFYRDVIEIRLLQD